MRQLGLFQLCDLLLSFSDIGFEGGDTLLVARRQHPPIGNPDQKNFGLKRGSSLGEIGFVRGIDEFLDVGRHLVAVGKQQVPARDRLHDRLSERNALDLQLFDIFGDLLVASTALIGFRRFDRSFYKVAYLCEPLLSLRGRRLVVIERVAQDGAADRL